MFLAWFQSVKYCRWWR